MAKIKDITPGYTSEDDEISERAFRDESIWAKSKGAKPRISPDDPTLIRNKAAEEAVAWGGRGVGVDSRGRQLRAPMPSAEEAFAQTRSGDIRRDIALAAGTIIPFAEHLFGPTTTVHTPGEFGQPAQRQAATRAAGASSRAKAITADIGDKAGDYDLSWKPAKTLDQAAFKHKFYADSAADAEQTLRGYPQRIIDDMVAVDNRIAQGHYQQHDELVTKALDNMRTYLNNSEIARDLAKGAKTTVKVVSPAIDMLGAIAGAFAVPAAFFAEVSKAGQLPEQLKFMAHVGHNRPLEAGDIAPEVLDILRADTAMTEQLRREGTISEELYRASLGE